MRRSHRTSIALAIGFATLSRAADALYVTDIGIYSLLAPCAAEAVSYNIVTLTYSSTKCGDSEQALKSCACSNADQFKSITAAISAAVSSSCGSTATDDQQSASKVMQKYCNPGASITFSTPTTNIIQAYITDVPQISYLPPCAQSAVYDAVMGANSYKCPKAANLFAPCVCSKGGIPEAVSDILTRSVRSSCSNGEDITAAQAFYNEYCAMNKGTTTFSSPPGPPGDMTYHITALSQFKALRSCAQTGVSSAILDQTAVYCAAGPQALASCVCLKSGMSGKISSTVVSNIRYYCDGTATADITSALAVFDYYCSAADDKVVVSVSETATESYLHPTTHTASGSSRPSETGESGASSGAGGEGDGDRNGSNQANKTAIIVGCSLGAVVIIAIIGAVAFILRRRHQKQTKGEQLPPTLDGPPELDNTATKVLHIPELNSSERQELQGNMGVPLSELPPSYQSPKSELQGSTEYKIPQSPTASHELPSPGTDYRPSPLPLSKEHLGTAIVSPATPSMYATGWQSGPVEAYELDSTPWKSQRERTT